MRTFLCVSLKLGSQLSFYVYFFLWKCVYKNLYFYFNRSKDVLVAHCCTPCLPHCISLTASTSVSINQANFQLQSLLFKPQKDFIENPPPNAPRRKRTGNIILYFSIHSTQLVQLIPSTLSTQLINMKL